jgi:hypothetical protein
MCGAAWLTSFGVSHSILRSKATCLNGEHYTTPRPQLSCLVHDAPLLLALLFGRSQPNRMPWGASWRVKILETTV